MIPGSPAPAGSSPQDGALREAYNRFRFVGRPWPGAHPARMHAVATLLGIPTPDPARARILDIGCGDGGHLVPIAATWPDATCVGIDIAEQAVGHARDFAAGLGLRNVAFHAGDLRDLPAGLGPFDYIVAHGLHSWVPGPVREALLDLVARRLAPEGIAFISHNTQPGCRLRELAWSVLRPATAGIDDPERKVARAREIARTMADAMARQPGLPSALATEFAEIVTRPAFAILHDDLASINEPTTLRDFVAQAAAHGLGWAGDVDLFRHLVPAFGDAANAWLAGLPRIEREQMVDHIRLRRFRESLLVHPARATGQFATVERLRGMHVSAASDLVTQRTNAAAPDAQDRSPQAVRRALLDMLIDRHPASVPVERAVAFVRERAGPVSPLANEADAAALVLRAAFAGAAIVHPAPLPLVLEAGAKPRAFAPARWQATRHDFVANLRHEAAALADDVQRRLLPSVDGTRTRAELGALLAGIAAPGRPAATIDEHLAHFGRLGILEA